MTTRCRTALIILALMMPFSAVAHDPCDSAKALWKERHLYDVKMQLERVEKRRQIAKAMADADEITLRLIDVKKRIVEADGTKREELWKQADAISAQRDRANEVVSRYSEEFSALSSDRRESTHKLREREFDARLQCVLNEGLGDRLAKLANTIKGDEKISADRKAYLLSLIESRQRLIDTMSAEMKTNRQTIEKLKSEVLSLDDELKSLSSREYNINAERERKFEESSNLLGKSNDALADYGDRLSELSRKILNEIK